MDRNKRGYVIAGVLFLFGLNLYVWPSVLNDKVLTVTFFDVGQGDAIFIETPQNHQILIDGGGDGQVLEKLGKAMPLWDKTIDLVILTHPDQDHVKGLIRVLERYHVKNILWTGVQKDTQIFSAWEDALAKEQEEGANIVIAQAPQNIRWSKNPQAFMDILYPTRSEAEQRTRPINDTSIIIKLVFLETSFLFPGDISKKVERELVERGVDIDIDVLKIAHHGSKSSSIEAFLAAASPDVGIILVGHKNRYGHPHESVLARLAFMSIPVLRTDQNGDIVIRSDGESLQFETSKD